MANKIYMKVVRPQKFGSSVRIITTLDVFIRIRTYESRCNPKADVTYINSTQLINNPLQTISKEAFMKPVSVQ